MAKYLSSTQPRYGIEETTHEGHTVFNVYVEREQGWPWQAPDDMEEWLQESRSATRNLTHGATYTENVALYWWKASFGSYPEAVMFWLRFG